MRSFIPLGSAQTDLPDTGLVRQHALWAHSTSWGAVSFSNARHIPIAKASKVVAVRASVNVAPGSGKSWTFQLLVNGAATGPTWSIADTETDTGRIRLRPPVDLSAGDTVAVQCTPSGTPTAAGVSMYLELDSSAGYPQGTCQAGSTASGATSYLSLFGADDAASATENLVAVPLPIACTIRNLYVRLANTITSGNYEITLMKNGVATSLKATVTGGAGGVQSANDTSNSVTFAAGDTASLRIVNNAASAARGVAAGVEIGSDVPDLAIFGASPQGTNVQSATRYMAAFGQGFNWNTTETAAPRMKVPRLRVEAVSVNTDAAPGTGKISIISVYTSPGPFDTPGSLVSAGASMSNAETSKVATVTPPVEIPDGQHLYLVSNPFGSPSTTRFRHATAYRIPPNSDFLEAMPA